MSDILTHIRELKAASARGACIEARHSGDMIRVVDLIRGDEIGMIAIFDNLDCATPGNRYRVGSFLPGETQCSPGDTPKTWPEQHEMTDDKAKANRLFADYLTAANRDGWRRREW